jgi:hypothetical protein
MDNFISDIFPLFHLTMPTQTVPLGSHLARSIALSCLLLGSLVLLPRVQLWLPGAQPTAQRSSADRPEAPFLRPITYRPLVTMLLNQAGVLMTMLWWSTCLEGWMRVMSPGKIADHPLKVSLSKVYVHAPLIGSGSRLASQRLARRCWLLH